MPRGIPNVKHLENSTALASGIVNQFANEDEMNKFLASAEAITDPSIYADIKVVSSMTGAPPFVAQSMPPVEPAIRLARVKLDKHYNPVNPFSIVGHTRPEIKKKNPAGREEIFQTEEWIPGEMTPAVIAGTGFKNKVWAGTVIELPEAEAKAIVKQKIGSLEFAD